MFFCFLKDTATTRIYTDRHTLSLHDALPIYGAVPTSSWNMTAPSEYRSLAGPSASRVMCSGDMYSGEPSTLCPPCVPARPAGLISAIEKSIRSEEHTSELQSLMRISYAVFSLTKNKSKIPSVPERHTN